MALLSTSEVREHFSEIINQVAFGKDRKTIGRRGKELVAIIPIEDLRSLEAMEDKADLLEARTEIKQAAKNKTKSWETLKQEVGL